MNVKNSIIRAVAVIGILTLLTLTVLPGCNFIGQADPDDAAVNTEAPSDIINVGGEALQTCPICSSTDITGPDEEGYFVCNSCSNRWIQNEDTVDIVDDDGEVIDTIVIPNYTPSVQTTPNNVSSSTSTTKPTGSNNSTSTTTETTTKSLKEQFDEMVDRWDDVIDWTIDDDGNITVVSPTGKDTGLLGFKYSQKDKCFITAEDAWQRNFGYNKTYDDSSSVIAISYDTFRVFFNYDGLEWMVQYWKGQYGMVLIGAEVGIYYRPEGSSASTHYNCADDEKKMLQSMDVYRRESSTSNKFKKVLTRSPSRTWWCTGFVPGTLAFGSYNPNQDDMKNLRVDAKITLHSPEMAQAFMQGLREVTQIETNVGALRRKCIFQEMTIEEYESKTVQSKFALEEDGVTVRVCWR